MCRQMPVGRASGVRTAAAAVLLCLASSAVAQAQTWQSECEGWNLNSVNGFSVHYDWGSFGGEKGIRFQVGFESKDAVDWGAIGFRAPNGAAKSMVGFGMYAFDSKTPDKIFDSADLTANQKPVADATLDALVLSHAELNGHTDISFWRKLSPAGEFALAPNVRIDFAVAWGTGSPFGYMGAAWDKHSSQNLAINIPVKPCTATAAPATPAPPPGPATTPAPVPETPIPANIPVTATPPLPVTNKFKPNISTMEPTPVPPPTAPPTPSPPGMPPVVQPGVPSPVVVGTPTPGGGGDDGPNWALIIGLIVGDVLVLTLSAVGLLFAMKNSQAKAASRGNGAYNDPYYNGQYQTSPGAQQWEEPSGSYDYYGEGGSGGGDYQGWGGGGGGGGQQASSWSNGRSNWGDVNMGPTSKQYHSGWHGNSAAPFGSQKPNFGSPNSGAYY